MNATNEPSPLCDVSDALSPSERAFRADLNQKLRAPLNAIIGFAELLSMRSSGSATKDADVQHILKAARDLLGIITQELGEGGADRSETVPAVVVTSLCDVLYIEDDPVNFTLVARILEFRPALKLMHVRSGEEGLELVQAHHPKMVLLDLNLRH